MHEWKVRFREKTGGNRNDAGKKKRTLYKDELP
jgi:hypothetical protein